MTTLDTLFSSRTYHPKTFTNSFKSIPNLTSKPQFPRRSFTVRCEVNSSSLPDGPKKDDFITKVLKQNPSQIEPRYLIGGKFYSLKEKQSLSKKQYAGLVEFLISRLNIQGKPKRERSASENEKGSVYSNRESSASEDERGSVYPNGERNEKGSVYLTDILRDYKGKLYVPEQIFKTELLEDQEDEEELFARNLKELPKMSFEEFWKAMETDKVKSLTSKAVTKSYFGAYRDFIVDLKEIPGEKSLHRTKWAMRVKEIEALKILEEYKGPHFIVERCLMSTVGKLPEYPHPVASSMSSRMMVELRMVTAVVAAAAVAVGGFLASVVFSVTNFVFGGAISVTVPIAKRFVKLCLGIILDILERVWEQVLHIRDMERFTIKWTDIARFRGAIDTLQLLIPCVFAILFMVLVRRYTNTRRRKNFKTLDIWEGIEFSRSKAEARVDGSTGVKFADVAGIDDAVEELQELVRYLKNPELFDKMGIKPPHGVLLEGPPGCGKTLVAKAIAGEAGVPFYQMAGSEFVEALVGVGSARIRDLFKRAKVNRPSVIFVDEIDALATRRQGIYQESTDHFYNEATQERETTLNQLLIELDGFDTGKGVIFLAATNRRDLLDPALLRPGRFDRKIRVRPPNAKGRLDILKIHASKVKMSESVDLSTYAKNLPGWSGAKLAQLVQEAALSAVRHGHTSILQSDMDDAVDRLTVGPRHVGIELGHQGQCRRAVTEVGLAITSHLLRRYENARIEYCDRISIIPRGQTLSQIVFQRLDDEAYSFERKPQLLHRLQVFLGARAAEEIIYGRDTSTASVASLADASWLARKIITIWNLENPMVIHGEPPPWRKKVRFVGPRLDFEGSLYDDYGLVEPPINFNLDDQVAERTEKLIGDMYARTVSLLRPHCAALFKAVKVLVCQKEMSGEEIDYILDNYPPQTHLSRILEEEDRGSLPFIEKEGEPKLDYALPASTEGKT